MISWDLWAVFATFAARSLALEIARIFSSVAGLGIAIGYVLTQGHSPDLSTTGVSCALAAGVFSGVAAISSYVALENGTAAIATTVTALYFVVVATIGVVFL